MRRIRVEFLFLIAAGRGEPVWGVLLSAGASFGGGLRAAVQVMRRRVKLLCFIAAGRGVPVWGVLLLSAGASFGGGLWAAVTAAGRK
jgi:hypothetical protein